MPYSKEEKAIIKAAADRTVKKIKAKKAKKRGY